MVELVLTILAGVLLLDVALELFGRAEAVQRRRQLDHDRAAMRRTLERTGGRRPRA